MYLVFFELILWVNRIYKYIDILFCILERNYNEFNTFYEKFWNFN